MSCDPCLSCRFLFQSLIIRPALSSRTELNTLNVTSLSGQRKTRSDADLLPQHSRPDPPQFLHLTSDPEHQTQVDTQSPDVGSCFTAHPEDPCNTIMRLLPSSHITSEEPPSHSKILNRCAFFIDHYPASSLGRIQSICSRRLSGPSADASQRQSAVDAGTEPRSTSPVPEDKLG